MKKIIIFTFLVIIFIFVAGCIPLPSQSITQRDSPCEDSDEGVDPFIKGTVTMTNTVTGIVTSINEDRCKNINTVIEYYCIGSDLGLQEVKCQTRCVDGVCVS